MFRSRQDLQILWSIVLLVAVFVMNLIGTEGRLEQVTVVAVVLIGDSSMNEHAICTAQVATLICVCHALRSTAFFLYLSLSKCSRRRRVAASRLRIS